MLKKIFILTLILAFSLSWSDFQFVHSAKWVKHNLHYSSQLKTNIAKHINSNFSLQSNFEINSSLFQNLFLNSVWNLERLTNSKSYIQNCEFKFLIQRGADLLSYTFLSENLAPTIYSSSWR